MVLFCCKYHEKTSHMLYNIMALVASRLHDDANKVCCLVIFALTIDSDSTKSEKCME